MATKIFLNWDLTCSAEYCTSQPSRAAAIALAIVREVHLDQSWRDCPNMLKQAIAVNARAGQCEASKGTVAARHMSSKAENGHLEQRMQITSAWRLAKRIEVVCLEFLISPAATAKACPLLRC